jgi:hypothetical protein
MKDGQGKASEEFVQDRLEEVSQTSLGFFEEVAAGARAQLEAARPPSASNFAAINTLTADRALRALATIFEDRQRNLLQLCGEPAIARLIVTDEAGKNQTIFVSRTTPQVVVKDALVVSYRAPMGRLAAMPVGQEHEIYTPRGARFFEVLERAVLKPTQDVEGWDELSPNFGDGLKDQAAAWA